MDPYTCAKVRHDPPTVLSLRMCDFFSQKVFTRLAFFRLSVYYLGGEHIDVMEMCCKGNINLFDFCCFSSAH